jgi:murein DD-endopeptidase MepM/ murein hydrolase activator NlpD
VAVPLGEGCLTLPLSSFAPIGRGYDLDPTNLVRYWNESESHEPKTPDDNNHSGIDYDIPVGTPVLAAAPGIVVNNPIGPRGQIGLVIFHPGCGIWTGFNHLNSLRVKVGDTVYRGQQIAESGQTGTWYPHLHFNLVYGTDKYDLFPDPYAPLFDVNGIWGRSKAGGEDMWLQNPEFAQINKQNYWTVFNSPYPP